jgi:hypothetical protein
VLICRYSTGGCVRVTRFFMGGSPRLKRRSGFPRCRLLLMCCRAAIPWRRSALDLRRNFRRPLRRLCSEHKRRRHVGRRCRGGDTALVRDEKIAVTRDLWHTGAVADDHCNQHQTYYRKKRESWHRNIQTVHAPSGSWDKRPPGDDASGPLTVLDRARSELSPVSVGAVIPIGLLIIPIGLLVVAAIIIIGGSVTVIVIVSACRSSCS